MRKDWSQLVQRLTDLGQSSEALERLRQHLYLDSASVEGVEAELQREIAFALGRAGAKVDACLLELQLLEVELRKTQEPEARAELIARHEASRRRALGAREDLKIHREAIGVRRNDILLRMYPIPPPFEDRG